MDRPSGDFQVSGSLRPSGAANAGCTVATLCGVRTGPNREAYGSGARSTSWTTKPSAVPVRLSAAVVTETSAPSTRPGEPSTGNATTRPRSPCVSPIRIWRPSPDQPRMLACASRVAASARGGPPSAGITWTCRSKAHDGGSSLTVKAMKRPSGE